MAEILRILALGIPSTLIVAVGSWLLCAIIAIPLTGLIRSERRVFRHIGVGFMLISRGVPELVAMFLIFFGLQEYVSIGPTIAAIVSFGVVESPFAAEIYRAALTTVGSGQRLAAESIGLSRVWMYLDVVVPQAVRFAIPPMVNLFIGMLNLSAVAAAINVRDVIFQGQLIMNSTSAGNTFLEVTVGICIIYLGMIWPISLLSALLEKRQMNRRHRAGNATVA